MRMDVRKEKWKYSMLMGFGTGDGCLPITGKWIVQFYDDNETTKTFPDKEVSIVN